jgi:hypothetical protein
MRAEPVGRPDTGGRQHWQGAGGPADQHTLQMSGALRVAFSPEALRL